MNELMDEHQGGVFMGGLLEYRVKEREEEAEALTTISNEPNPLWS